MTVKIKTALIGATAALDRVKDFAQRRKQAYEDKTKTFAFIGGLWAFLEKGASVLNGALSWVFPAQQAAAGAGAAGATGAAGS